MPDPRDVAEEERQPNEGNVKEQGGKHCSLRRTATSHEKYFFGGIAYFYDSFSAGKEVPHVSVCAPTAAKCVEVLQDLFVPRIVKSTLEVTSQDQ